MKRYIYSLFILALAGVSAQAQEFDDIYYNPKNDAAQNSSEKKSKKSNYIKDFSSLDVDKYNRRGQYYESPIDTIGAKAEGGEDFVYTQKIQKFYNPTIVVDNAEVLSEVIDNSYGNVEIVFDNGLPYFNSVYGWPGYYDYYSWMPSRRWGGSYSWSYSPVWGFELWPSWSLGPSWAWGPSLSWTWWNSPVWGWGPSWAWGPNWGWGPGWGAGFYADYSPWGRQPNRPGSNWAYNTRPGYNSHRTYSNRYGNASSKKNLATNYHRTYSFDDKNSVPNRVSGPTANTNRRTYTVGNDGHRRYGSANSSGYRNGSAGYSNSGSMYQNNSSSSSSHRSSSSYGTSSSSNRSSSYTPSRSSGSSSRSSGGSYGGGRTSSGGRGRR